MTGLPLDRSPEGPFGGTHRRRCGGLGSLGERRGVGMCTNRKLRVSYLSAAGATVGWSGGRSVGLGGWVVVPAVRAVRYNFTAFFFQRLLKYALH